MNRPTCLCCGEGIRKATRTIDVKPADYRPQDDEAQCWSKAIARFTHAKPSRGDLIALANKYGCDLASVKRHKGEVWWFSVWDRKSYSAVYGYFCTNRCAGEFAQKHAAAMIETETGLILSGVI